MNSTRGQVLKAVPAASAAATPGQVPGYKTVPSGRMRWPPALAEFGKRVPDLAHGLAEKIAEAHTHNRPFEAAFASFFSLCRLSLNPNIAREAVDEMLVQHLLTERLFRTIFDSEANTGRVDKERKAPITVIIGNPPYNVGQLNENDNNKNRKYPVIDGRIRETYAKDSKATLKNKLSDAYVKFFRWATDRLEGRDGIICFVSNNSFVDQIAFDGMRNHLMQDFTQMAAGNAR